MLLIPFCGYQHFESWCEYDNDRVIPNSKVTYKERVKGYGLIIGEWIGIAYEDRRYTTQMVIFGGENHGIWRGASDLWANNVCEQWRREIGGPTLVQNGKEWKQSDGFPEPLESSMINCGCLLGMCSDVHASYGLDAIQFNYFFGSLGIRLDYCNYGPWDIEGIYRDSIKYYQGTPPEYPWESFVVTSRPQIYDDDDRYY